jgi:hypothetical protein
LDINSTWLGWGWRLNTNRRLSSSDLELQGQRGKALDIIHVMGDALWLAGHGRLTKEPLPSFRNAAASVRSPAIRPYINVGVQRSGAAIRQTNKLLQD